MEISRLGSDESITVLRWTSFFEDMRFAGLLLGELAGYERVAIRLEKSLRTRRHVLDDGLVRDELRHQSPAR